MLSYKILLTTCLSEKPADIREYEYRAVLSFLMGAVDKERVLIVDTGNKKSFLDDYGFEVHYSGISNSFFNKGCNETQLMLDIEKNINTDRVIKLTGRYLFKNRNFINTVENDLDMDVLCRLSGGKLWTGCFCANKNIFFEALRGLDLQDMENRRVCLEDALWDKLKVYKVRLLDEIGILSRISNNNYISYM